MKIIIPQLLWKTVTFSSLAYLPLHLVKVVLPLALVILSICYTTDQNCSLRV